jgi:rubredoxin
LDSSGWLVYPNRFHCPKCGYGVYFNEQSLSNGFSTHQERPQKLNPNFAIVFQKDVQLFLSNKFERFILDFHCPQCQSPYVIGFEAVEFHMAHWRYRPMVVFSTT